MSSTSSTGTADLARLAALVEEQSRQLAVQREQLDELRRRLDDIGAAGDAVPGPRSRRDLLRLAGAGLAGAAATTALRVVPAAAGTIDGSTMNIGATNSCTLDTVLNVTPGANGATGLTVAMKGAHTGLLALECDGIGGGAGLLGTSDTGAGVVGGAGGYDFFAAAGGNYGAFNAVNVGAVAPTYTAWLDVSLQGTPATQLEIVRGIDGEVWVSRHGGTGQASWRRLNSLRFDKGDGTGALLTPFRILDTRSGAPVNGGATVNVLVAGNGGVPADAVGVVGNVTAVGATYDGFLTVFPAGATNPATTATPTSTLNFVHGGAPTPNCFVVGLRNGALSVFANNQAVGHTVHVLVDITGYVQ